MHDVSSPSQATPPRVWLAELFTCSEDEIDDQASILTHKAWDSMAHVQIMLYLEEHYGVEMTEETIQRYGNLAAIQELHDARARP